MRKILLISLLLTGMYANPAMDASGIGCANAVSFMDTRGDVGKVKSACTECIFKMQMQIDKTQENIDYMTNKCFNEYQKLKQVAPK